MKHAAFHATWISTLVALFTQVRFLSDFIEKLYDKTQWLRDLIKWESKKKHKRRKHERKN